MHKEATIKELKNLLEEAQKTVLQEINTQKNFLAKVFSSNLDALKSIQSNIAKSLNQIELLGSGDSASAKLQVHLSEKDKEIKRLEDELKAKEEEFSNLESKLNFSETQLEKAKAEASELNEKLSSASKQAETTPESVEKPVVPESLPSAEELEKLKEDNKGLKERLGSSKEELKEAQETSVELSKRLNKLKSELLVS